MENIIFLSIVIIFTVYYIYLTVQDVKDSLKKMTFQLTQPNEKSKCPDYWDLHVDKDGKVTCIDTQQIGDSKIDPMCTELNFNTNNRYNMSDEDKCNWSTKCKIPWIGYDRIC